MAIRVISLFFIGLLALLSRSALASHSYDGFCHDEQDLIDLPVNTWCQVPNSELAPLDPCSQGGCSYSGNTGFIAVMDAWNSGAFDTARNRLMVFGGGHGDYGGNGVYAFDVPSMSWLQLKAPYNSAYESTAWYDNEHTEPSPPHTYDGLEYVPAMDAMVLTTQGCWSNANACPGFTGQLIFFDLDNNTWGEQGPARPSNMGDTSYGTSAVNPNNSKIYTYGSGGESRLFEYDPNQNDSRIVTANEYMEIYSDPALDPTRNIMISLGYGQIMQWDLDNANMQSIAASTSGATSIEAALAPGFEYDTVLDRFVAWDGGTTLYSLDPDNYIWTAHSTAAENQVTNIAKNPNGTWGRFRYMSTYNAYVVVNSVNSNVYFYKLTSGAGSIGPSLSFSASATLIDYNDDVVLSWNSPNADSCEPTAGWSASISTSGNHTVRNVTETTVFSIACSDAEATSNQSVLVTVNPPSDTTAPTFPPNLGWSVTGVASIKLSWSASSDSGGSGVAGYKIYRDDVQIATTSNTSYHDIGLAAATTYRYSVLAYDNEGNESPASKTEGTTLSADNPRYRINAGGDAFTDSHGRQWSADSGSQSGTQFSTAQSITSTTEDELFQSQRINTDDGSQINYAFSVESGEYTVLLYFAEIDPSVNSADQRVFDIELENILALEGLDIYEQAGGFNALVKSFTTSVTDGELNIDIISQQGGAVLSAIEIYQDSVEAVPAPTIEFNASATDIDYDGSVVLEWSSNNTSTCKASGNWSGIKASSGSQTIASIRGDSHFNLLCVGAGGSADKTISVNVDAGDNPTLSFNADANWVSANSNITLNWEASNVTQCSASGDWAGDKKISGSETIQNIEKDSTFILRCEDDSGGFALQSVSITVVGDTEDKGNGGGFAAPLSIIALLLFVLARGRRYRASFKI